MQPVTLQLNIPARLEAGTTHICTDPEEIATWIGTLPLADPMESARILYSALVELNRTAIIPAKRLQIVETLRLTIHSTIESLTKLHQTNVFPLGAKAQSIADLVRELFAELAISYKITLLENENAADGGHAKIRTLAIHRAIRYLSTVLLQAYEIYAAPSPAGFWKEIHEIYHYAEQKNVQSETISDSTHTLNQLISIENLYKRILLLTLACPYRLRQGEAAAIYEQLEEWSDNATLSPLKETNDFTHGFLVNLETDEPPIHAQIEANGPIEHYRLLNTKELAIELRDAIKQANDHPPGPGQIQTDLLTKDLLRRIYIAWNVNPKRKFSRAPRMTSVMISVGLRAIFDTIASYQKEPINVDFDEKARFDLTTQDTRPVYWEMTDIPEWVTPPNNKPEQSESPELNEWDVINASAGGFCLLWSSTDVTNIQVGELLCIKEDEQSSQRAIGVVRWMRCKRRKGMEIGVEMLSPDAIAVPVRHQNNPNYFRALQLAAIPSIGQPAALITAVERCKEGDILLSKQAGQELALSLVKYIENTGHYAQFQIAK